jgi:hypothetical protein
MKTIHIVICAKIGSGIFCIPTDECCDLSEEDEKHNKETSEYKGKSGLMKGLTECFDQDVLFKDVYYIEKPYDHVIIYYNPIDLASIQKNDNCFVFGSKELGCKSTSEQIAFIKKIVIT